MLREDKMDPLTHAVIGLSIAKATGNDMSAFDVATFSIVAGSVFPDIDILLQKWGDYAYLKNHRGVTHSVVGLMLSSFLIAPIIGWIFKDGSIMNILLYVFLGGLSHVFFDLFNPYGANIMWPINKKKFSFKLLTVFDPLFFILLAGYILINHPKSYIFIIILAIHILSRFLMKRFTASKLNKVVGNAYRKISVWPSFSGLFSWHFVLEGDDCNIVGERSIIKRSIKVKKTLKKIDNKKLEKVLYSKIGEFFREFSPLVHVASEKMEGATRYVLIDMRYYIRDKFLHHGVLEVDENEDVVTESFNPYSISRASPIPDKKDRRYGKFLNRILYRRKYKNLNI